MTKVFLVEDEYTIREGIKRAIHWEEEGFELVGEAGDGEMAYPRIRETEPDILITDIRMPFMDGLQLATLVKKDLPNIRILILSGYDDFQYAHEAIRIGVAGYLLKPLSVETLLEKLHEIEGSINEEKAKQRTVDYYRKELEDVKALEGQQFLRDVIDGKYSMVEAIEQGREYDMDLAGGCYSVMLMQIRSSGRSSDAVGAYSGSREEIYERIHAGVAEMGYLYEYLQSGETMCFLRRGETAEQLAALQEEGVANFRAYMEQYPNLIWFLAYGEPVERIRDVKHSYETASRKFAMRYMYDVSHVFLYSDPQEIEVTNQRESNIDYRNLDITKMSQRYITNFLQNGSIAETEDFVRDYFASMGKEAVSSYILRQYVVMGTIFCMLSFLETLGVPEDEIYANLGDMQESLRHIERADDTQDYIKDLLIKTLTVRNRISDSRYTALIKEAVDYMRENYSSEEISLQSVASAVNVSASHFSTVFKQETGQNFVEFLTDIRMDKARELLTCTSMRTSDVGYAVGYKDPHYFSYIFKKVQGVSPREYRAQQREGQSEA